MAKYETEYLSTENAARMCPKCAGDSRVYDCREQPDGSFVRRRRCVECETRFATIERLTHIISENSEPPQYIGDADARVE